MPIPRGEGQNLHIPFGKEPGLEPQRRGRQPPRAAWARPDDRARHGREIDAEIATSVAQISQGREGSGIDTTNLIVLEFENAGAELNHDLIERFGARIVDERETRTASGPQYRAVLQFATAGAIERFRQEVAAYRDGGPGETLAPGQRRDLFDSLRQVRSLSRDDRIGDRLRIQEVPAVEPFKLDVDLWHPGDQDQALLIDQDLRTFCRQRGGRVVDDLRTESLLLYKIECNRELAEALLNLDLVARADLPPLISTAYCNLTQPVNWPNPTILPADGDPIACVIDSGVVAGHPLLANWVIEERDFHTGEATAVDLNGHGTAVAGLVAYGDIASCLESNRWEPRVRICSAKVLRNQPNLLQPDRPEAVFPDQSDKRIESVTEEAIRYFHGQGCRVFNLSVGDASKVYSDQRQFSWAELLDDLTRELDIVIVVSTGNNNQPQIPDVPHTRDRFRKAVREQTLQDRVTSPATAALALTVGSLARSEGLPAGTIAMTAGAPEGGPSPFTRTGPGYAMRPTSKGIKPDVVDFGGNFGLQAMTPAIKRWAEHPALGEPSLQRDYVNRAVRMFFGTSYAAPHVTHAAALAECALRDALGNAPSACLIRAAVGAACAIPAAPRGWYTDEGKRCKMIGYGRPVLERIPWSTDNDARLVAMDDVEENKFHLYRVPIPADFIAVPGPKGITIALAFDPPVRGSRKMYMARTMSFYPMLAVTIQDAHEALSRFDGNQDEEEEPRLPPERQLRMTPGSRRVAYSALQVRRAEWGAEDDLPAMVDGSGESALTVAVFCQQRFATDPLETRQRYGLVVDFWHAGQETRLYEPLRARVRPRLRQQARI